MELNAYKTRLEQQLAELCELEEIAAINAALKRIENDDFGYCKTCDEAIAEPRLKHNPAVELCLQCAVTLEQG